MDTQNSTADTIILDFPSATTRTYAIAPGATSFDVETLLEARIAQLDGLLAMTWGEVGDAFRSMDDELQGRFMWACADLAKEVRALYEAASKARAMERNA